MKQIIENLESAGPEYYPTADEDFCEIFGSQNAGLGVRGVRKFTNIKYQIIHDSSPFKIYRR